MVTQESAKLNVGQRSKIISGKSASIKSTTLPIRKRSVKFPSAPEIMSVMPNLESQSSLGKRLKNQTAPTQATNVRVPKKIVGEIQGKILSGFMEKAAL